MIAGTAATVEGWTSCMRITAPGRAPARAARTTRAVSRDSQSRVSTSHSAGSRPAVGVTPGVHDPYGGRT